MKNILKNILAGGVALMTFAACDMDLLPSTYIEYDPNKPIFVTENDVVQWQNGVMSTYRALQGGVFSQCPEVMFDAFNAVQGYGNNYGEVHRLDGTFTTANNEVESIWGSHYVAIKNYNIVITGAEKEIPEELQAGVNVLEGIARFCRASSYLELARYFGSPYDDDTAEHELCVPLVTVYNQYAKPGRATVYDIYEQIYADLSKAEKLLKNELGEIRAETPTIDAVKALFARYYLDIKKYGKAAEYAMEIINSDAGYSLASSATTMKSEYTNDSGSEPILQLYADRSEGKIYNSIFTNVSSDDEGKYFGSYFIPSQKILNAYEGDDLRFKTWFSSGLYPIKIQGTRHEGITIFVKYLDNPNLSTGVVETGAHKAKPLTIGEMYLIAAEAYAMDNQQSKAKNILNRLQSARKATATDGDMESIKKEWFRETVGQGYRFFCLKRWGDGFDKREGQPEAEGLIMDTPAEYYANKRIEPKSHLFNLPIPSYEIKLNHDLKQNDGYSK